MLFSPRSYGREQLFVWVAAPLVALLGPTLVAIRLPIAIAGVLTVLTTYLLARELLHSENLRRAQWTALLAAAFLALSFWHLALNHLSFRANYLPLLETLAFLFLWRAVRTNRLWTYLASGIFLGLSLYTYTSSRFVPVVLAIFFALLLASRAGRWLVLARLRRWLLLAGVAALVVLPLLAYFALYPDDFLLRARGVSIFSPWLHGGDFWDLVRRSVTGNFGLFGFKGDPDWLYNLPGRPGLDPIQAVLFWLGLVLCLVGWRRPQRLFLVVWWLVMLLPSILAPDPIPHSLRAIGTLPAASIVAALALTHLIWAAFAARPRLQRPVGIAALLVLPLYLAWLGYDTWHNYYDVWAPCEEVYEACYGYYADLACQINADGDPSAIYILPINYDRRGGAYTAYPLDLLHQSSVPYGYIAVDDATVAEDLTEICAGKDHVRLILWTHGEHVDADPRGALPFYLERFGRRAEEKAFQCYRIRTYDLVSTQVDFRQPLTFTAAAVRFGSSLALHGVAHEARVPAGDAAWIALRWGVRQPPGADYKLSLRLINNQGQRVGQSDVWLLSNEHCRTCEWQPGAVITTYHLVPARPGTLPGDYQLRLVVYDPQREVALSAVDGSGHVGDELRLGSLQVTRSRHPVAVEPEIRLGPARLSREVELTGYALQAGTFHPGDTANLALYWHAVEAIEHQYAVVVQWLDSAGRVAAEWSRPPGYPMPYWHKNDVWRDWHTLQVPHDLPAGRYQMRVTLQRDNAGADGTSACPPANLVEITVEGWSRSFKSPTISNPQAAQWGTTVRFLGYDMPQAPVQAGDVLPLTLYWQATGEPAVSYKVFTHLIDASLVIWGQQDSIPGGGDRPTTGWAPGEVITDEYRLPVRADAPAGAYVVEIGLYQPETGERLPVTDDAGQALGDRILLDTAVQVVR
jgi:hypothetical protein